MNYRGFVTLRSITDDTKKGRRALKGLLRDGMISEDDFMTVSGAEFLEFAKANRVEFDTLKKKIIVRESIVDLILDKMSGWEKTKENRDNVVLALCEKESKGIMPMNINTFTALNKNIVNEDSNEEKQINEGIEKIKAYSNVFESLNFGKAKSVQNALHAYNNNIDIFEHAENVMDDILKKRIKKKKQLLICGIRKAALTNDDNGYRQAFRRFEENLFEASGINIGFLSKNDDEDRYGTCIELFCLWSIAFKIVKSMIDEKNTI